ncbi:hypothetical protein GCM10025886_26330 [Tetragenococcus halophilus subsp. flandriensis]|uniref:transglutaminase-like domain-containing protein n=1 Tax=Tetragenococcus halophilus TaxID=51669 RepID=UPI0023E90806|nr:transglutaminase domain-containing protein [Tetragenococcus halophilus]GMA09480.1 hypothetical protein GCM10025886_26330 [Tetragenococcus halophilus subsp. flandriensis]
MRKRIYDKAAPIFLTFLTLTTAFYQLLKIYHMEEQFNRNIIVIALFCLIAGIIPKWFIKIPLHFLTLLIGIFLNFSENMLFSLEWATFFCRRVVYLYELFIIGRIGYLPEEIAISVVFFVMFLLAELIIEYERVVISYLIIIGYMLFLIVYNDIELHIEVIFFASLGLLQRFLVTHNKRKKNYFVITIVLSVLLFITWLVPSDFIEMRMLEPSATLRNYLNEKGFYQFIEETGAGNASRSGFSENDEVLGGPLLDDNQIVLEAQQQSPHYWRIDSKRLYSGSGWQNSAEDAVLTSYSGTEVEAEASDYQGELASEEEIILNREAVDSYIPLPYGNKQLEFEDEATEIYMNQETQRIDFQNAAPASFQMNWQDLDYTMEELSEVSLEAPGTTLDYLQLPDQLPERVVELAEELTADQDTLIEKVRAIEDYLQNSGNFRYSKIDAGFPTENQDYVDYFLFDSQVGYCDNFSSAMVVMLRAVGIPARWAKGFSSGEQVDENHYVVRNSDAHSWAEVYFEGYGWLPFEATPSFSQPLQQNETTSDTTASSTSENTTSQETTETTTEESTSMTDSTETTESETAETPTSNRTLQISPILRNIFYGLLTVVLVGMIYMLWHRWFYLYILVLMKIYHGDLLKVYPVLLKKAEKFVYRMPEQPLNQYAQIFENYYPEFEHAFIDLTTNYEKSFYGNKENNTEIIRTKLINVAWHLSQIKKRKG